MSAERFHPSIYCGVVYRLDEMEFAVMAMKDVFGNKFDSEFYDEILEEAKEYGPDTKVLFTLNPKNSRLRVEMVFPFYNTNQ